MVQRIVVWGALVLGLVGFGAARADYIAYTRVAGHEYPLPADLTQVHTLNLVDLRWSDYAGARTRIAVNKVDNTSSIGSVAVLNHNGEVSQADVGYQTVPIDGIEAMITDILNRSNRFRMVERQAIGNVLQEQDFGASGRVAQPSAAKIGNVLGAEYLVEAVITHYEAGVSQSGGGAGLGGLLGGRKGAILGGIGVKKSSTAFGMNIRLVDAQTSEIVFTKQINREIKESGLTFGGLALGGGVAGGGFISNFTRTPIGQTVLAAINEAAFELIQQVGERPASGAVVKVEGRQVYLNLGNSAVSVGDRLTLLRPGQALIDPTTGISLGSEDEEIGSVVVRDVRDKFSIAAIESSLKPAKAADRVISTKRPAGLEYGPMDSVLAKKPGKAKSR